MASAPASTTEAPHAITTSLTRRGRHEGESTCSWLREPVNRSSSSPSDSCAPFTRVALPAVSNSWALFNPDSNAAHTSSVSRRWTSAGPAGILQVGEAVALVSGRRDRGDPRGVSMDPSLAAQAWSPSSSDRRRCSRTTSCDRRVVLERHDPRRQPANAGSASMGGAGRADGTVVVLDDGGGIDTRQVSASPNGSALVSAGRGSTPVARTSTRTNA